MREHLLNEFPEARRSACSDASLAAELRRVRSMTVEERIKEALALAKRFRGILPPQERR